MLIYDHSDFISFKEKSLTSTDIKKLYIPSGLEEITESICKVDGKYYYYKGVDFEQLINELIGSYLSKQIGLDAVDYKIGVCKNELYALSEIFFDSRYEYHNCRDFFGRIAKHNLTESEDEESRFFLLDDSMFELIDNPEMILNILKLSFLDIKMGQIDRNNLGNIMVKKSKDNGNINLAPIIDFECSYDSSPPFPEFYFYDNPFLVVRKNELSLTTLINKYPDISDTVILLANLKIRDILKQIEREKRIKLSDKEKSYLEERDEEYSKVLRK